MKKRFLSLIVVISSLSMGMVVYGKGDYDTPIIPITNPAKETTAAESTTELGSEPTTIGNDFEVEPVTGVFEEETTMPTVVPSTQPQTEMTTQAVRVSIPQGTTIIQLRAKKKGFTVWWKKRTIQTTGYQVQYATNRKFTENKKKVMVAQNQTVKKKIKKLQGEKKYFVRIRTYKVVNGKKYYSTWSKGKTVTTKS